MPHIREGKESTLDCGTRYTTVNNLNLLKVLVWKTEIVRLKCKICYLSFVKSMMEFNVFSYEVSVLCL